jgi:aspartyl-tRNA synthetase
MLKYGSDKPDLRNPLEITDVTHIFQDSEFTIFKAAIEKGGVVRAIKAPDTASKSRKFFDDMIAFAISEGANGLGYIQFLDNQETRGPIAKFLSLEYMLKLKELVQAKSGDSIFFSCANASDVAKILGKVRIKLGHELELLDLNCYEFCWITDFPFYEINSKTNKIDFSHNPFSMPQGGLEALINATTEADLLKIKAYQYDIVCNGIELSSGAIRNHKPELMYKAFEIAGYSQEIVDKEFGGMIRAFKFGAPPHGGIAPGIDRIVMLIAEAVNIREVIAFPMNQQAEDLLMNAPNDVTDAQLQELNIMLAPLAKSKIQGKKTHS